MMEKSQSIVENSGLTPFLKKLTVFCSGGPFLDGYILIIISGALVQLEPLLKLDTQWTGLIGAASLAGLFIGGAFFGYITDLVGRQKMFEYDLAAIVILSVLQIFAQTPAQLVVERFLIGIAVGADYPIATSLLAEFAPKKYRGFVLGLLMVMWYIGAMLADIVGYLLINVPNGWRWMLGSAAIPALILMIGRMGTPESPRWLVSKNRIEEARKVMKQVYGPDADLADTEQQVVKTKYSKLFTDPHNLKSIVLIGGFWLCQLLPQYGIYTYGPKLLALFGLASGTKAMLGDIVISALFLIGVIPAIRWVDTLGRRPLIIGSFVFMSVGVGLLAVFSHGALWVIGLGFGIYALSSGGPSILQWIYPNELFPTEIRASATGLGTAISRVGACIGTYGMPIWLASIGLPNTMWILTGVSFLGLIVCIVLAPETRGLSLAEAASVSKSSDQKKEDGYLETTGTDTIDQK